MQQKLRVVREEILTGVLLAVGLDNDKTHTDKTQNSKYKS